MRYIVLALALSFSLTPMEATAKNGGTSARTVQVKAKRSKNTSKARKARRPAKRTRNRAN